MRVFDAYLQDNKVLLMNKSDKKVLLRLVTLHYQVTTISLNEERISKTVSDEIKIEKEIGPREKIEIKVNLPYLKSISLIYSIDDKTFRDDIEF